MLMGGHIVVYVLGVYTHVGGVKMLFSWLGQVI